MYTRGGPSAWTLRLFKSAWSSTWSHPLSIIWDKKIKNLTFLHHPRPDFVNLGVWGIHKSLGSHFLGWNLKSMWKPYTGIIFEFLKKFFLFVKFLTLLSKKCKIHLIKSKKLVTKLFLQNFKNAQSIGFWHRFSILTQKVTPKGPNLGCFDPPNVAILIPAYNIPNRPMKSFSPQHAPLYNRFLW